MLCLLREMYVHRTAWKSWNISVTQILREINYEKSPTVEVADFKVEIQLK